MSRLWRTFSPTQFIRIFVIVNITAYATTTAIMGGKKGGENTRKVAGNAKKAEAAAQKQAQVDSKNAAAEAEQWSKGAKDSAKKADVEAKKAEAAAKKAERDRLLAEEEASQPSKPKGANKKTAEKKSKGLDLSQLDDEPTSKKDATLNASGIDNALDALALTGETNAQKLERHPERRFKAAYAKFEEYRMPEIEQEHPGLRKNQRIEICRKEFEKHPDNPFNQVGNVRYDATKEDLAAEKQRIRSGVENRLGEK